MREDGKLRNHKNRAGEIEDDDSGGEYAFNKKDDESIDDSGSDVGWNSDDELIFGKKSEKPDESLSEEEEEDFDDDGDGILLSDMLKTAVSSTNKKPEDDEESMEQSVSGSEEEEDDEELDGVHSRLLSAIDKFAGSNDRDIDTAHQIATSQKATESSYSSLLNDNDVSMQALLGALNDTRGLVAVKKHLGDLEKGLAAPKYVEKVTSERQERQQVYEGTKEDMNKWQEYVVTNRHQSTLDLAQDKRRDSSYKSLVSTFKPTTSMEKEIQMELIKSGTTEKEAEDQEVKDLQAQNLSLGEIRQRQAELAKVKALMFYEQMKRHRINKIKSKAYRTIRRKQKARKEKFAGNRGEVDLDEEEQRELDEKNAFNRVKERMNLKHKNTSKWAKMAMERGHADKSLRDAYHESVRLGHELSQRINGDEMDQSDEGDEVEDKGEYESEEDSNPNKKKLLSHVRKDLQNVLESAEEGPVVEGKFKKLFEMDFMQRAAQQQRERAREEAQNVLKEIKAMEEGGSSGEEEPRGQDYSRQIKNWESMAGAEEAKKNVAAMFKSTKGLSGGMSFDVKSGIGRNAVVTSVGLEEEGETEELAENPWVKSLSVVGKRKTKEGVLRKKGSEAVVGFTSGTVVTKELDSVVEKFNKSNGGVAGEKEGFDGDESGIKSKKKKNKNSKKDKEVDDDKKVEILKPLTEEKTQAELVDLAFSGPGDELEKEFQMLKEQEVDQELGLDMKQKKIISEVKAGWGDWAGPGATGIGPKILAKREKLLTAVQKQHNEHKSKRKDSKMMNVMINERRIKTAAKYKIGDIPHPFTTREEYERSLQMPIGDEWNASTVVKSLTQPEVKLRAGRILEPAKLLKRKSANSQDNTPSKKAKKIILKKSATIVKL